MNSNTVSIEQVEDAVRVEDYVYYNTMTICVLTLPNGFMCTGESACVSPENFDTEIGRSIARKNALDKVWMLLGYDLKNKMYARELKENQL